MLYTPVAETVLEMFLSLHLAGNDVRPVSGRTWAAPYDETYGTLSEFCADHVGVLRPFLRVGESGRSAMASLLEPVLRTPGACPERIMRVLRRTAPETVFTALVRTFSGRSCADPFSRGQVSRDPSFFRMHLHAAELPPGLYEELCELYACMPVLNLMLCTFLLRYESVWRRENERLRRHFTVRRGRIRDVFETARPVLQPALAAALREMYGEDVRCNRFFISMFAPYGYYVRPFARTLHFGVGVFFNRGLPCGAGEGREEMRYAPDPFDMIWSDSEAVRLLHTLRDRALMPEKAIGEAGIPAHRAGALIRRLELAAHIVRDVFGRLCWNPAHAARLRLMLGDARAVHTGKILLV